MEANAGLEQIEPRPDVKALGLTPVASMAFSFAVLLEGVTNADISRSADQRMYVVAAMMLGIAGVSHFFEQGADRRPTVEIGSFGRLDLAQWWAGAVTRMAVDLATQLMAIYLAYLLCKRGGSNIAAAFLLACVVAISVYVLLATLLRWFFALRQVSRWLGTRLGSARPATLSEVDADV